MVAVIEWHDHLTRDDLPPPSLEIPRIMAAPVQSPCTSVSNCLVVTDGLREPGGEGGVWLHSSRRPDRHIFVGADEWEAHVAEIGAGTAAGYADSIERIVGAPTTPIEHLPGLRIAARVLRSIAAAPPPSAKLPADDAPPVPGQAPEPQGPAEGAGSDCGCWNCREHSDGFDDLLAQRDNLRRESARLMTERDTARAAAETFQDELDRTGEQLLAVTAERDILASGWESAVGAVDKLAAECDQLRERVDADAWDRLTTDRDDYRAAVLGLAQSLADVKAERDRLAETLRGADPWADTGGARLAEYLALHWPDRAGAGLKADQTAADVAIEVLKDLCGQLAQCHADLARMRPIVDAAVVWRDAGWNTYTAGPAADLSAAVGAWNDWANGDAREAARDRADILAGKPDGEDHA